MSKSRNGSGKRRITFFDFEVFAHDWMVVFETNGFVQEVWNDPKTVEVIVKNAEYLCGFNISHYDIPILATILSGGTPEDVKATNEQLIVEGVPPWVFLRDFPIEKLPPCIDLFQDLVPFKSLKEIAGNLGLSIVESEVSFDIDQPLTDSERLEVARYCRSDVRITRTLYEKREAYVEAKFALCDVVGIPYSEVRRTNAGLVALALSAVRINRPEMEHYTIPENISIPHIPDVVLDFVSNANTINAIDTAPKGIKLEKFTFDLCGVEAVFGLGGIHAARKNYQAETDDTHTIIYQDITSYYPSLILNNGYLSRNTPSLDIYQEFYDMRIEAKKRGDTAVADAAKLVLNTTFGASKALYNPLYDPLQAISICLSGQLYIVELMNRLHRRLESDLEVIQVNTDGWILRVPKTRLAEIEKEMESFKERTAFNVETKNVRKIVQRDVNNYIVQFENGKIETKGGDFGAYPEPSIRAGSLAIVGRAIVDNLIHGVPVETTIRNCTDPHHLQLIHKAGRAFDTVVWEQGGEDIEVQRVNRIYPTTDTSYGFVRKVKSAEGRSQKIPLCPPHSMVDNSNEKVTSTDLSLIDWDYYVRLATDKIKKIVG